MNSRLHLLPLIPVICILQLISIIYGTESYASRREGGFYLWKDFLLEELAKTPKFRGFYFYCFGGEQRCPIDGVPLMNIVPDMIRTKCANCTHRQFHLANTVLGYLRENEPEDYLLYFERYDPEFKIEDFDIEIY